MANQDAIQDRNQFPGLIAHSGTADTAETRKVVSTDGNLHVKSFGALSAYEYDNIAVAYPDGTTETYTFKAGTVPAGTISVTYTDSTKGSISTVVKS